MRDYIEHLLIELHAHLANHVNEENPLSEDAQAMVEKVKELQAQYALYQVNQSL